MPLPTGRSENPFMHPVTDATTTTVERGPKQGFTFAPLAAVVAVLGLCAAGAAALGGSNSPTTAGVQAVDTQSGVPGQGSAGHAFRAQSRGVGIGFGLGGGARGRGSSGNAANSGSGNGGLSQTGSSGLGSTRGSGSPVTGSSGGGTTTGNPSGGGGSTGSSGGGNGGSSGGGGSTGSGGGSGSSGTTRAASRCTPANFPSTQAHVVASLKARVYQLDSLATSVTSALHVPGSDGSQLLENYTSFELPGIEALIPQAESATNCAQIRQLAANMILDYRVYLLVTPQTQLTLIADHESYIENSISSLENQLNGRLRNAQATGQGSSRTQQELADLQNQLKATQSAIGGITSLVLQQAPQDYPSDSAILRAARNAERLAGNDLGAAHRDLWEIRHFH
jgi:hypothetical protein